MRILRVVLLSLAGLGVALSMTVPAIASDCDKTVPVELKRIGHPIWKPVDFHVFTAPVGTADDGYAEFNQTMINLLYPLRHRWCGGTDLAIGPGDAHQPPYNHEFEGNLDIVNFTDSLVFRVSDFTPPKGVWAVWMTVPNPGAVGSSPDFVKGPIIPNWLFPIHVSGETYRNNQLWNPYLGTFDVPPLTTKLTVCPFDVDGHSHFPEFYADTSSFGPGGPTPGHYEFRITMMDVTGNGWSIIVAFTVQ